LFAERATEVADSIEHEDGVRSACNALEELWRKTR